MVELDPSAINTSKVVQLLKDRRDALFLQLQNLLKSKQDGADVKQSLYDRSFLVLMDLLMTFSPHLSSLEEPFRDVSFVCPRETDQLINRCFSAEMKRPESPREKELERKEAIVTSIARAASFDVIRHRVIGPKILSQYLLNSKRISDVIKVFHGQLRKAKAQEHLIVFEAIKSQYLFSIESDRNHRSLATPNSNNGDGSNDDDDDDGLIQSQKQGARNEKMKKVNRGERDSDQEDKEQEEQRDGNQEMSKFFNLCQRLAMTYSQIGSKSDELDVQLYSLLRIGFEFAVREHPKNLEFLTGLASFLPKLRKERCATL